MRDEVRELAGATREGTLPLHADPSVTCTAGFGDDGEWCGKPSRFAVRRSDGNPSFGAGGGTEEACEKHLSLAVTGMIDGDENIRAIVAIRWDPQSDWLLMGPSRGATKSSTEED